MFKLLLVALFILTNSANAQITIFTYEGSPTSYILMGRSGSVTEADGTFGYMVNGVNWIYLSVMSSPSWLSFSMAAPHNARITEGMYAGATQFPGGNTPGLVFGAFNRSCSGQTGYFNVLEIQYGADNTINSLAVDFTEYDFGITGAWNKGSIRYNSFIPIPEPDSLPILIFLSLCLLPFLPRIRRSARRATNT